MDLEEAARRLYAMPLDQFMATRKELVAEAREAKDRDLAATVGALRKPSVTAWVVNQIVRLDPAPLADLTALGERLREAQSTMDGAALRRLGGERTAAVEALVARAGALAAELGAPLPAGVVRDLHDTFTAAVMSEGAGAAVTSGRMVRALSYAGFGEVDVSDAVAVPRRGGDEQGGGTGATEREADDGVEDAGDTDEGDAEAARARSAARAEAQAVVEARRTDLDELGERQRAAEDEVNDLEDRLERARAVVVELVTERGRATRALRTAEESLGQLGEDGA